MPVDPVPDAHNAAEGHDRQAHDDVFNAVLAKAVQESIITLHQSLPNNLKKKMRIKLVALYAAAHACRGVDWKQLNDLVCQCKINDDSTLADNLELVAGIIGARQKAEREELAEANLASAKSDAQRKKFQAELNRQKKSLPRATLCPALKVLIRQQEEGALDRLTDAERTGDVVPHAGASLLAEMIIDIRKKGHVLRHEPTLAEWRAMGLYQYQYEMEEVWPDEFKLVKAISTQRIREWIVGLKPGAAIDGPMWWAEYARKCGYVKRDNDGKPLRDKDGQTIPLEFNDDFQIDHLILSSSAHESKDHLLAPILDHPDNYMIVYKGPNQHPLFKKSFGKLCLLKGYLLGAIGAQHVTNAHQHRQRVLELNRKAVQEAANKALGAAVANQHLKPYTTAHKANQEKNMKRLLGGTRKQDAINAMFAAAPNRTKPNEGAGLSGAADDDSDTSSTEQAVSSGEEGGAQTPPGSPLPPPPLTGPSAKATKGKKRAASEAEEETPPLKKTSGRSGGCIVCGKNAQGGGLRPGYPCCNTHGEELQKLVEAEHGVGFEFPHNGKEGKGKRYDQDARNTILAPLLQQLR